MSEIERLRKEIKAVTVDMIKLMQKRMQLAEKIGKIKREQGMPIESPETEKELVNIITEACKKYGVSADLGLKLLDLLISQAKEVQKEEITQ